MGTFFWELSPYQIGFLIIGGVVGTHLGFFLAPRLHERFDKRHTIAVSAVALSVFWSMAVNLALLGLSPANSSWTLVSAIIFFSIFSSGFGAILNISVMSALADVADQLELNTGLRLEGVLYSARAFFSKAMNAVGHVVAGYALQYYVKLPPGSVPGEVPDDIIFRLGVLDGPLAMIGGVVAGFVYLGYRLDKSTHREIRRLLEERAGGSVSS